MRPKERGKTDRVVVWDRLRGGEDRFWGLGFSLIGVSRENEKFLEVGFNFLTVI